MILDNRGRKPVLNALDPNLSFIASKAAVELDNLLLGKASNLDAVAQLASCLQGTTEEEVDTTRKKSLMDPQTIDLVSRAINVSGGESIKTIDELAHEAWRIAGELHEAADRGSTENIERLRSFCVALSRIASAQRQKVNRRQPSHPFRR